MAWYSDASVYQRYNQHFVYVRPAFGAESVEILKGITYGLGQEPQLDYEEGQLWILSVVHL
jgi:hypothetical protein